MELNKLLKMKDQQIAIKYQKDGKEENYHQKENERLSVQLANEEATNFQLKEQIKALHDMNEKRVFDKQRLECDLSNKVDIERKRNDIIEIQKQELQM